jgi:hypothetical protein
LPIHKTTPEKGFVFVNRSSLPAAGSPRQASYRAIVVKAALFVGDVGALFSNRLSHEQYQDHQADGYDRGNPKNVEVR